MKFKVPGSLLSKCDSFLYHSLSDIYENHEECPLTKFEQFSKCCFGEIFSQLLTTPPYIIYGISK